MLRHPGKAPRVIGGAKDPLEAPGGESSSATIDAGALATPSLQGLGFPGLSRRRVAWAGLALAAAWIVVGFAGQAAEASRSTADLAAERARAAVAAAETEALRREVVLVTEERWILQQARAYQLGTRSERPFALAPDAPPLPADAPGSAITRLGAGEVGQSPLEVWLEVLFGPLD